MMHPVAGCALGECMNVHSEEHLICLVQRVGETREKIFELNLKKQRQDIPERPDKKRHPR